MLRLSSQAKLILASTSPRRAELLKLANLSFTVHAPEADETPLAQESAESLVGRLAIAKAKSVAPLYPEAWVLGADTVVEYEGQILGKPRDGGHAFEMLSLLQGRTHRVWGAFCLGIKSKDSWESVCSVTEVTFCSLSPDLIKRYVASGEPEGKAGAYAIQGGAGLFISRVEGSYTNIVGLDVAALFEVMKREGLVG